MTGHLDAEDAKEGAADVTSPSCGGLETMCVEARFVCRRLVKTASSR